ncbi:MAG: hypothetical protein COA42_08280 [Alteromonadaceae bacterium]|nr:MAG: hypothetical protein COA42_08280 [Alteromonadaceae bacterium]
MIYAHAKPRHIAPTLGFLILLVPLLLISVFYIHSVQAQIHSQTPTTLPSTKILEQLKSIEIEKINHGVTTQKHVNRLDEKRQEYAHEYRQTLKQNSNLEKYNRQLRQTIQSQDDEIDLLQNQIKRIAHLERDIVPLMVDMLDALKIFVELDVPFLRQERFERIATLRGLLSNGKVSNSEKYRRILEAYQIENDYGRTIEAYPGEISSELKAQETQSVTFFKVGRIAYMYQTLDKSKSFRWNQKQQIWQLLDEHYNRKIDTGIKMAREQIPSNLMFIPIDTALLHTPITPSTVSM